MTDLYDNFVAEVYGDALHQVSSRIAELLDDRRFLTPVETRWLTILLPIARHTALGERLVATVSIIEERYKRRALRR